MTQKHSKFKKSHSDRRPIRAFVASDALEEHSLPVASVRNPLHGFRKRDTHFR